MNKIITSTSFAAIALVFFSLVNIAAASAATLPSKYLMVNTITWDSNGLSHLPLSSGSEFTYFVLTVSSRASLDGGSYSQETTFVKNVHGARKKATFSVGGGAQSVNDITQAIVNRKSTLINNIASHLSQYGYDGVTIDIENTSISAQTMADFIKSLRFKLDSIRPNLIIGVHTQPYQISTVWGRLDTVANYVTWVAPMLYDFGPYSASQWISTTNAWLPKVGNNKSKLLAEVAVNYPSGNGGLNPIQFSQMLDAGISQGWAGFGIWNNVLYTQPYTDVVASKVAVQ